MLGLGLGGLAGAVAGFVGALIAGIVQITAKRMRNDRLIRRGEPPIKDVILVTLWPAYATIGAIAGLVTGWLADSWPAGALAGAALPALAIVLCIGWGLSQLRR